MIRSKCPFFLSTTGTLNCQKIIAQWLLIANRSPQPDELNSITRKKSADALESVHSRSRERPGRSSREQSALDSTRADALDSIRTHTRERPYGRSREVLTDARESVRTDARESTLAKASGCF